MRLRSTASAGLLLSAALSVGFTGTAHAAAADRDCKDFSSQAAAQAAFDAVPGDPERLDADNDGQACENYDYSSGTATTTATTATSGSTSGGTTSQVSVQPAGAVAAGDGSTAEGVSALPYVLGGLAFAGAGGAAVAARRSSRSAG